MEIKNLKKVMEAIELLHAEKLISEKVASKYLTEYLAKQNEKKQEEINRLNISNNEVLGGWISENN